jgi:hypothetical protein
VRFAFALVSLSVPVLLSGCGILDAAPAASVLGGEALEADAAGALARADEHPDDIDAALRATRLLFAAADVRMQRAQLAWIDANPDASLAAIVAADDSLPDEAVRGILALCTDGLTAAERVLAARPGDAPALLHRALHLSLVAWANGPMRSLFAGFGPKLVAAIDAAVAADPLLDHGAPLRLRGRFRGRAPWPYGDLAVARSSLEQAVAAAPIVVNELFLGDVLLAAGERPAARAAWQRATVAADDERTRWSAETMRELARRRIAALDREAHR